MRLLFCYLAEKVYEDENGDLYVSGNFTPEVWDRYLALTDDLHVLMTLMPNKINSNRSTGSFQKIDSKNITIHPIPVNTDSVKKYFSLTLRKKRRLIIEQEIEKAENIIIRTVSKELIKLCDKHNKRYAIEVVGCAFESLWNHSIKGKVLAIPNYFHTKKLILKAPYVLYVTKEYLQKKYPTKGKTISCSNVSLTNVSKNILENRINKIVSDKDKLIIGTAAAVNVKYKGQKYVIKALALLKKKGINNLEYQLVGGGDASCLLKYAKKYGVEDKVIIKGRLSHDRVMEWLQDIDIYVQPSLTEGLPRSVIEAMSYGITTIGSNVGGIPELLASDMVFKKRSSSQIANIIKKLTNEMMIQMAYENYNKARDYNEEILKKRRFNFYSSFINDKSE